MEFNLDEMSLEELNNLLAAIQAKLNEIEAEPGEEREGEEEPAEAPALAG
jgi:hypothetical protein